MPGFESQRDHFWTTMNFTLFIHANEFFDQDKPSERRRLDFLVMVKCGRRITPRGNEMSDSRDCNLLSTGASQFIAQQRRSTPFQAQYIAHSRLFPSSYDQLIAFTMHPQ